MTPRLEGKVCVITGAGGSMGRACALAIAREGGSMVGCDVSVDAAEATVELLRGAGGDMISTHPHHSTHRPTAGRLSTWRSAVSAVSTWPRRCMSTGSQDITDVKWVRGGRKVR